MSKKFVWTLGQFGYLLFVSVCLFTAMQAHAQGVALNAGDIVITSRGCINQSWCYNTPDFVPASVLKIDRSTGQSSVITSGGNLTLPAYVAIDANRNILVADPGEWGHNGKVIKIDPATGNQTVVSSGGLFAPASDASTPPWGSMSGGIAVERDGGILVAANYSNLIRVDAVTGAQTLLSSGGLMTEINCVAVAANGSIFVGQTAGVGGTSSIVKVDPVTGAQTLVSSGGYLPDYWGPMDLTVDAGGNIIVSFQAWYSDGIVRIDPATGDQTLVTAGGAWPFGIAVDVSGDYLWLPGEGWGGSSQVVRVNASTGEWTTVAAGLVNVAGIAVVPGYNFIGYLSPIRNDGSSLFQSGRTIPVRFQLTGADGSFVTNAIATLQVGMISSSPTGTVDMTAATASGSSNTGNQFRFDPTTNQYVYNLSTAGFAPGTYRLRTTVNDGTVHDVIISLR